MHLSGRRRRTRTAAVVALLVVNGCNTQSPVLDTPVAPGSVLGPALPSPTLAFHAMTFAPPAVVGGGPSEGTVTLTVPASSGGVTVALASSHPSVSVPASVLVPEGRMSASFPVATEVTSADTTVNVAGSMPGHAIGGVLPVWAVLPTFFWWIADPRDTFWDTVGRGTPPGTDFKAYCLDSDVHIHMQRPDWGLRSARFSAPRGTRLVPGVYEGATRSPFHADGTPGLSVELGTGCNQLTGRFVVHEADFTESGAVRRFRVSFEQHCSAARGPAYGEIRLTDTPHVFSSPTACRR